MSWGCAFLRGANVGGRAMRMGDLCAALAVPASGNVIFFAAGGREAARRAVERAIEGRYGAATPAFLYSAAEVRAAIDGCPLEAGTALRHYAVPCQPGYVEVLERAWAAVAPVAGERAAARGGWFYWQLPKGCTLTAGLSKALEGRAIAPHGTARNLNTLQKVSARMARLAGV